MVSLLVDAPVNTAATVCDRRQHLEESFKTNSHLQLRGLVCESQGDVVILRGQVNSYYLKQMAQELVKRLAPDAQIANLITVSLAEH